MYDSGYSNFYTTDNYKYKFNLFVFFLICVVSFYEIRHLEHPTGFNESDFICMESSFRGIDGVRRNISFALFSICRGNLT